MPLRDFKSRVSPDFVSKAPSQAPVYLFDCILLIKRLQSPKAHDPESWNGYRAEMRGEQETLWPEVRSPGLRSYTLTLAKSIQSFMPQFSHLLNEGINNSPAYILRIPDIRCEIL